MAESPIDGLPADIGRRFAQLQEDFLSGLGRRWQEIQLAADPAARQAALHRLAGAAGSFGFPTLGAAARRAEAAMLDANTAEQVAALSAVAQAIDALSIPSKGF